MVSRGTPISTYLQILATAEMAFSVALRAVTSSLALGSCVASDRRGRASIVCSIILVCVHYCVCTSQYMQCICTVHSMSIHVCSVIEEKRGERGKRGMGGRTTEGERGENGRRGGGGERYKPRQACEKSLVQCIAITPKP